MPKPSNVIVVVEDEHHEMLVRRYLRNRGLEAHQMRFERSPAGEGSAEQWVRMRFAKEVSVYRRRLAKAATALIVVIDADIHTVDVRLAQLGQALQQARIQAVKVREAISQLIPKRNVETWILCLSGEPVDEMTDYKHARDDWHELIPQASQTLFQWTGIGPGRHCVDSLRRGLAELRRLDF